MSRQWISHIIHSPQSHLAYLNFLFTISKGQKHHLKCKHPCFLKQTNDFMKTSNTNATLDWKTTCMNECIHSKNTLQAKKKTKWLDKTSFVNTLVTRISTSIWSLLLCLCNPRKARLGPTRCAIQPRNVPLEQVGRQRCAHEFGGLRKWLRYRLPKRELPAGQDWRIFLE